ncbi:MAG: alpha/beta fold hydrolase [Solirubrobacteraceae bacterium]
MSISINYHREGSGPPLLLLHGVGHHWQGWQPVIERLSADFDVIACDSPGFGRSAPLPSAMEPTITSYADAFEWFLAELGLERPHLAGNSMGGAIGLELARRRAVSSVTAFSPAGFWTASERRFCQLSLGALARVPVAAQPVLEAAARTRAGRVALFSQTFGYPSRLPAEEALATLRDAWRSPALAGALEAFDHYSFQRPEQLRSTPVTIAWGVRDRLLPYRLQAPRARAMLPWATHLSLGAGHVPYYDDPAAVAAAVSSGAQAARAPAGAASAS